MKIGLFSFMWTLKILTCFPFILISAHNALLFDSSNNIFLREVEINRAIELFKKRAAKYEEKKNDEEEWEN